MKALFIGRFQPIHNGHLEVMKKASKEADKLIIVIGSANKEFEKENPFSLEERKNMIEKALNKAKIKNYEILSIDDVDNHPLWFANLKKLAPDFDIAYCGSGATHDLLKSKGIKVIDLDRIQNISASDIREKIKKDEHWQDLVPDVVFEEIERIHGVKRVKELG